MKTFILATLLACAAGSSVTPVQKVLTLLNGMLEKGKKEKHEEEVQHSGFKQWCSDTTAEKTQAIEQATMDIEKANADIASLTSDMATLSKDMDQLAADNAKRDGDMKAATKVRNTENTDHSTLDKDLSESIDALQRAIAILKKQAFDRKQAGASFVELDSLTKLSLIPVSTKQAINAFLERDATDAPEAAGYEFQSHGIIDILDKLLNKFIDERQTARREEANAKHSYEMIMQDLTAQTEQAQQDHDEKKTFRATAAQNKADTQSFLQETTATKEEDSKFLSDMTSTCNQKASDFASRQELRAEEIATIEKAIEIISSGAVAGNAEKHLPTLLQGAALAQLRSEVKNEQQERVAQYLMDQSRQLNSRVLSTLATRIMQDPFLKVKKMIKDLIVRLMEEANEEAEHKGWCDTELSTNEQLRKEKTESVEMLQSEIDELTASIAKLGQEIKDLTKGIAELDAAMAKATDLRNEEKAKNTETIADAKDAQAAVAQALTVLKEFYEKAGDATALVQQQPTQPEIFEGSYNGMQSENGGVVGMLEVIESDFARLEADTVAAENSSQKQYDQFMTESKVDKADQSANLEHRTEKKQGEEQTLAVTQGDLEGTQKELDAALAYYDKLKPSCVDAGVSYSDRVARRKEEIQSLQEALRILNGDDLA